MRTAPANKLKPENMSPEARQYYHDVFLPRYQKLLADAAQMPISVLVWGPGKKTPGEMYAKRIQILSKLRRKGLTALFSEDIDKNVQRSDISLGIRELAQARAADFIIVLMASAGSIGEVNQYGVLPEVRSKMFVFVEKAARSGFSAQSVLDEIEKQYGNVRYFTGSEIRQCRLLAAVEDKLAAIRMTRWRMSSH